MFLVISYGRMIKFCFRRQGDSRERLVHGNLGDLALPQLQCIPNPAVSTSETGALV